jgi:hypothetical protein
MPRVKRPGSGPFEIYDDYPESDENTLYIPTNSMSVTLDALMSLAKDHFGHDVDFSSLEVEGHELHTRCVTYDLYDPSDWDDYIIVSRV